MASTTFNIIGNDMIGSTSSSDGSHGLVPSPLAGDNEKVLYGDGTWKTISSDIPQVTSSDNGKFLCVVNGTWAAATIPAATGVSF